MLRIGLINTIIITSIFYNWQLIYTKPLPHYNEQSKIYWYQLVFCFFSTKLHTYVFFFFKKIPPFMQYLLHYYEKSAVPVINIVVSLFLG